MFNFHATVYLITVTIIKRDDDNDKDHTENDKHDNSNNHDNKYNDYSQH